MTRYRKSRIRNAASRMKEIVLADGKVDVDEAKTVGAFVKPLVKESEIFSQFHQLITEIVKDGRVDFDEQLIVLKIINRLLDYLEKD